MFWNLQYFRFLKGVQYAGLFFSGGGGSSFGILFAFVLWFVWKKWILLLSIYFHCLTVLVSVLVILANPVRGVLLCALLLDKG